MLTLGAMGFRSKSKVTGKNQGRNLRVHNLEIDATDTDRYTVKIKKQRIGWRLRQIGKP
jgi:hypothetical protein